MSDGWQVQYHVFDTVLALRNIESDRIFRYSFNSDYLDEPRIITRALQLIFLNLKLLNRKTAYSVQKVNNNKVVAHTGIVSPLGSDKDDPIGVPLTSIEDYFVSGTSADNS